MPPTQLSAFHPSPKRKRDQQQPFVPLLNTSLRTVSTPSPRDSPTLSGADSPRNVVADQLRGMSIATLPIVAMSPLTPTDDVVRKKPKLGLKRDDSGTEEEDVTDAGMISWDKGNVLNTIAARNPEPDRTKEIAETPLQPQTSRPRIFSNIMAFAQPTIFSSQPANYSETGPVSSSQVSKLKTAASQSRARQKSPSPSLPSLTWQDSEITGHVADPLTDPDDDGTGLNGIGFKPTPALAYARAQKRRQQVIDWRAREAREARAKRSERRRRGTGGVGHSSREGTVERDTTAKEADTARRAVRFAI